MTTDFSWAALASCKNTHEEHLTADWYADADTAACRLAIAICKECPVAEECLNHALATHEQHGVWGAMTPAQRSMIAAGYSREQALKITTTYSRRKPKAQNGSSSIGAALR